MSPMRDGQTTNDKRRTREDRATQPNGCWMAEFRKILLSKETIFKMYVFTALFRHLQVSLKHVNVLQVKLVVLERNHYI